MQAATESHTFRELRHPLVNVAARGSVAWLALVAGTLCACSLPAMAQEKAAAAPAPVQPAAAAKPAAADDGLFLVSVIKITAGEAAGLLSDSDIAGTRIEVVLDEKTGALRAAKTDDEGKNVIRHVRLGDLAQQPAKFDATGLQKIASGLVTAFNYKGYMAVAVLPAATDVNDNGNDIRGGRSELHMEVLTGTIAGVEVIPMTDPKETKPISQAWAKSRQQAVAARIKAGSPAQPGDLVKSEPIDRFVNRMNRHPGRRVDAAIAVADYPGRRGDEKKPDAVAGANPVQLNYMLNEGKPWTIYAQASNTGTPETSEWRERFGFVHNQLTGNDDILQLDYITAAFDTSNAVLGSYDTALGNTGKWRGKVFGNWSEYDASEVGGSGGAPGFQNYSGAGFEYGAEVTYNLAQWGDTFLDASGGIRYSSQEVQSDTGDGNGQFLIPSLGFSLNQINSAQSLFATAKLEGDAIQDDDEFRERLGRIAPSEHWLVFKASADYSRYLDAQPFEKGGTSKAHEIGFSGRVQYAFDDARLVPTEETIMGGFYSVRGYDESLTAGDSSISATVEYRLHIAQLLGNGGSSEADSAVPRPDTPGAESSFRTSASLADWDLIARTFIDGAYVMTNDIDAAGTRAFEFTDQKLLSAGLGLELSFKRRYSARVDWGVVLHDVDDANGTKQAEVGDNRFHFLFTVAY
jgi:hemolysin activation/secretion protein